MQTGSKSSLGSAGKHLVKKGLFVQLIITVLILLLTVVFYSEYVIEVALGSLSFIVPHSIFAYWVFRYSGATKNNLVAQSLSQGMKIKLLLTSVFFVIAFSQFNAQPGWLLGAYAIIMLSQWLAMFWFRHH